MSNCARHFVEKVIKIRLPMPAVHLHGQNVQLMQSRGLACGNIYSAFMKRPTLHPWILKSTSNLSVYVNSSCGLYRCYSSEHGGDRGSQDRKPPNVRGVVFVLSNPLDWFRNMWHMWNIRRLDPSFNLDDFMHGAIQAVTVVTRYLSLQDFDSLKGLLTNDVITHLKEKLHYDEGRKMSDVSIEETDVVYKKAKTWKLVEDSDGINLYVDTFFVAMKYDSEIGACMMEIGFGFRRGYHEGGPGEWIIDNVTQFQVREFHDLKS